MFNFFANIFGYVLNFIYNLVQNYGIAIIIFTILLKLCMLPMSIKQQKTLKKSAKVQEELKILQDKYANDPVRLNQEMMDLYKKENMSPFSGCLSSILQLIIIVSIFVLVSKPLTFMLHADTNLINNYITEIQAGKEEKEPYEEIAVIREKSNEDKRVYINMDFLGLDLSSIPAQNMSNWKVFVIPALYVVTSIISMKITTSMQQTSKPKEEIEKTDKKENEEEDVVADMNKSMTYFMPIMSVSIAIIAPLGLALYWLVSNLLMIIERLVINKFFKEEA